MKNLKFLIISFFAFSFVFSCKDDDNGKNNENDNSAPSQAVLLYPSEGTKKVSDVPTFEWQPSESSNNDGIVYELYVSKDPSFAPENTAKAIDIHANKFTFQNYTLTRGAQYYWKVVAYGKNKVKSESKVFSFNTKDVDLKIKLLSPSNGVLLENHTADLNWSVEREEGYTDAVTYAVFIRNGSKEFSSPNVKNIAETTRSIGGLSGNGNYYWAIQAIDSKGGVVAQSETFYFKTKNIPPTPAYLHAGVKQIVNEDNKLNAEFKWMKSEDNDKILTDDGLRKEKVTYDLYLSKNSNFSEDDKIASGLTILTFTATGLSYDTDYFAKIVSRDENGGATDSNVIEFRTKKETKTGSLEAKEGTWRDPKDGKVYKTITINGKTWLAENYAYVPYVDQSSGDKVKLCSVYGLDNPTSVDEIKNNPNYTKYGALYTSDVIEDLKLEGWHVATDDDWKELEKLSGMQDGEVNTKGYKYRGKTMHKFVNENERFDSFKATKPTNEIPLNIVYGGYFRSNFRGNVYTGENNFTYIWTSTKDKTYNLQGNFYRAFAYNRFAVERDVKGGKYKMYIRLVKD
ncbi:hypothetical protein EDM00_04895 [Ornithobacterium rhinotracheale]|uniref:FISUMP domain-containing protein n=1 Tax=Ornithobacterium rhinotracheale TaxID=28251 RepID=UPI00129CD0A1|nr:FISUMP domain-containing protein [Ornithobacterium rhinotracheale]MRI63332.1 hypothetical protein [Ornithobacterium rhinotracheale]